MCVEKNDDGVAVGVEIPHLRSKWADMRALKGRMTSRMNASRLSYVFDTTDRPTIVHVAFSASRSNGPPVLSLHALKLRSIVVLFRDSSSVLIGSPDETSTGGG